MDNFELLSDLCLKLGVTGFEDSISNRVKDIFYENCDEVYVKSLNDVVGIKKGSWKNKKSIMLSAHMDEIGMIVSKIEDGFLGIVSAAGYDPRIILGQEVIIHGKKDIYGVIGAKPPHLLKEEELKTYPDAEKIFIDVGLKKEEIIEYVKIGDPVTIKGNPLKLSNNKIASKSLDNRIGVLVLYNVMKKLKDVHIGPDVYFVATTQEELTLSGAKTRAHEIMPDAAIIIDVTFGYTQGLLREETFELGDGAVITRGALLNRNFSDKLIEIAESLNIKYQLAVEPISNDSEVHVVHASGIGVPCALVSVPIRYMHTPIELADFNDINSASDLLFNYIKEISKEEGELF